MKESLEKLKSLKHAAIDESVFIFSWHSCGKGIYGRGCNENGELRVLPLELVPGLYCVTSDIIALKLTFPSLNIIDTKIIFDANNFTPMDLISGYEATKTTLVKIECSDFPAAMKLKNYITRNATLRRLVICSEYYDPQLQIYFELFIKQYNATEKYKHVKTTMRWFNRRLKIKQKPEPNIQLISFDIETVSSVPDRVPTGEDKDDIMFSISIHTSRNNEMTCLVYVPLHMASKDASQLVKKNINYDNSYKLIIFNSEKSMLKRALELLNPPELHYLVGYNSKNYDIKYLFIRSIFYNLNVDFITDYGLTMGWNQIHIDLFHLVKSRYTFKKYTLNNVASEILNAGKEDVNSVALRNTFFKIKKEQRLFTTEEETLQLPSLYSMILYNNQDTKLVYDLMIYTDMLNYARNETDIKAFAINALNEHTSKMKHKAIMDCFLVGLSLKVFLGTYPHQYNQTLYGETLVTIDTTKNLDYPKKNGKIGGYPGGVNYCRETVYVPKIKAYDYRIAYPYAIQTMGLSSETAAILPANLILSIWDSLNVNDWEFWIYKIHSSSEPAHSPLYIHRMIVYGIDMGGKLENTREAISHAKDSLIIVIWKGRSSVLGRIIQTFNDHREKCKSLKKLLDTLKTELESLKYSKILMDEDKINEESEMNNNSNLEGNINYKLFIIYYFLLL